MLLAALLYLGAAGPMQKVAHAEGANVGPGWGGLGQAWGIMVIGELLFPDFRVEFNSKEEDRFALVMGWPIAFDTGVHKIGSTWFVTFEPFVEGQYQFTDSAGRILLGARSLIGRRRSAKQRWLANQRGEVVSDGRGRGVAIEAAGVAGDDGFGGMLGLSWVKYEVGEARGQSGPIVRGTVTDQGWRIDLAYDVHFPL